MLHSCFEGLGWQMELGEHELGEQFALHCHFWTGYIILPLGISTIVQTDEHKAQVEPSKPGKSWILKIEFSHEFNFQYYYGCNEGNYTDKFNHSVYWKSNGHNIHAPIRFKCYCSAYDCGLIEYFVFSATEKQMVVIVSILDKCPQLPFSEVYQKL